MKRYILIFAVLRVIVSQVYAQSGEFIQFRDGTVIEGSVKISEKLFRSSKIILNDTVTFSLKKVEAYNDDGDYFKRIVFSGFNSGDQFALRTEKGNIDLFERYEFYVSPGYWAIGPNGTSMFMPGGSSGSNKQYFSKAGGPVLVANASNLRRELYDNPVSMEFLKKRDGLTTVQVIGTITGVVIGLVSITNQTDKDSLDPTGIVLGLGMVTGSMWIPYFAKQELTEKAIKAYNHPKDFNTIQTFKKIK